MEGYCIFNNHIALFFVDFPFIAHQPRCSVDYFDMFYRFGLKSGFTCSA